MRDAKDGITSLAVTDHEIVTGSIDCKVRRYDIRANRLFSDFIGGINALEMFVYSTSMLLCSQCLLTSVSHTFYHFSIYLQVKLNWNLSYFQLYILCCDAGNLNCSTALRLWSSEMLHCVVWEMGISTLEDSSIPKMEAEGSSKMVPNSMASHPEYCNFNTHCHKNLKPHTFVPSFLHMIQPDYVTTEMKLTVAGRALLVNEYWTTMKSVWPVKLVLTKLIFHIWGPSACTVIFLKMPPVQFYLRLWSP